MSYGSQGIQHIHRCSLVRSTKRGTKLPLPPLARPTSPPPADPCLGEVVGKQGSGQTHHPPLGLGRRLVLTQLILSLLSKFFKGKKANKKTQSSKGTPLIFFSSTHLNWTGKEKPLRHYDGGHICQEIGTEGRFSWWIPSTSPKHSLATARPTQPNWRVTRK